MWIAVIGMFVGIISNLLPMLGHTGINFLLALVVIGIHEGIQLIGFNGFPLMLVIFIQWYFVGTFGIKLLALLPIPYVQPIAQIFQGEA